MKKYRTSKGRILKVKYKGVIKNTVLDYLGGLHSNCTYINSNKIKNMSKYTSFLLVKNQLNKHFVK